MAKNTGLYAQGNEPGSGPMMTDEVVSLDPLPERGSSKVTLVLAAVVALAGIGWFVAAQQALGAGGHSQDRRSLEQGSQLLQFHRELIQSHLRAQCQVLSEDPRLKSTLSTPGIDEASIADVLADLREQAGLRLIATLTAQARVQAVLGGDQYRGLDLSTSSVVKTAQGAEGAISGTWVAGDKVVDVGVTALRVGDRLVGYLVIGASLQKETLARVHGITGSAVALFIERQVVLAEPEGWAAAFAPLVAAPGGAEPTTVEAGGQTYLAKVEALPGVVPPVRLAYAAPVSGGGPATALLWAPLVLSVVAAVGMVASSLFRRT